MSCFLILRNHYREIGFKKTRSKSNEFISFSEGIFGDLGSITCPDKFITYFVTQERCGNLRH